MIVSPQILNQLDISGSVFKIIPELVYPPAQSSFGQTYIISAGKFPRPAFSRSFFKMRGSRVGKDGSSLMLYLSHIITGQMID
jgi:hypothetical protein